MWDLALSLARVVSRAVSMILSHEHVASMYIANPAAFAKWARCTTGGIAAFWDAIKPNDPRSHGHLVFQQPGFRTHCIPLRLHGDGVPFGKRDRPKLGLPLAVFDGWRERHELGYTHAGVWDPQHHQVQTAGAWC